LIGLAGATALILYNGAEPVIAILASAGWGLAWVALFHLLPMIATARAWQALVPGAARPKLGLFLWMIWVREAVNTLLPVAKIGGEVAGAWLLVGYGVRKRPAVASLVVDMTMSLVSQFIFTLIGVALLLQRESDGGFAGSIVAGLLVSLPVLLAFLLVQRFGMFSMFARIFRLVFGERFERMVGGVAPLDRAVRLIYRRRGRIALCCALQLVGWLVSSGEMWLGLYYLGQPATIGNAVLITALVEATSSTAFVVPGAVGIQEGGFLILGQILGLTPDVSLALALVRRARDVLVFGPALAMWQLGEGRRLVARQPG
jgi:glycosyltransferase 2 family protein